MSDNNRFIRNEVLVKYNQGMSREEIALDLNISVVSVNRYIVNQINEQIKVWQIEHQYETFSKFINRCVDTSRPFILATNNPEVYALAQKLKFV